MVKFVDKNIKTVLYVVDSVDSAQFRYRVKNVAEALEGLEWKVEWVLKNEIERVDFERFDLAVILRQAAKDDLVLNFIELVKAQGIKVLFDLDDLVFDYHDLPVLMKSIGALNVAYWLGYFWGIRRIAKMVDGFICTNDFLAGKLKRSFGKPVRVIPNSLNDKQIEVSKECVKNGNKKHKGFTVGYFSGSPTHERDFKMVEPELVRFLGKYDDTKLKVVGYMNFSKEMQEMIKAGKVEILKLVDYLKLQKLMAEVDVNIAPLLINDFTNCKSELKFFEAAAVETTTIASPTYAFKKAIIDGENGFLAQSGEWFDKLEYLYEHPKENGEIAKRARECALKYYYGKEFLKKVEEAYGYFAK